MKLSLALLLVSLTLASDAFAQNGKESSSSDRIDPTSQLLWFDVEGGVETAQLNTFQEDFNRFSVGFIPRSGTGPAVGGAVGVRMLFITLGARGRVASFQNDDARQNVRDWSMASLDGELGVRVPLHRFEPYFTLAGGYTTLGGLSDAVSGIKDGFNVNGFNVRAGLGFDYYVAKHFSIGALGSGEVIGLTRPGIPARDVAALHQSQTLGEGATRFLEADGSSYGTALALTGGLKASF